MTPGSDDMYVTIGTGSARATVPKKDYAGDDWANMNKDDTNAALKARIQISITGLKAFAQPLLPVNGLDESKLPAFWSAVESEAFARGKW